MTALKKAYEELLSLLLLNKAVREKFIADLGCPSPHNWQSVHTPFDIVREMIDLLPANTTRYAVLFSLEFIEVLVKERNVSPDTIVFFADTDGEEGMARRIYGVKTVMLRKDEIITTSGFNEHIFIRQLARGLNEEGEERMKFNKLAVIQNPPFQQSDGGHSRSAKPIYHLFIETIIDGLAPDYFVSINPSRYMQGGKGLDKFRARMINDKRVKVIVDDMRISGIFPSVEITGGVHYFLWDKSHNGKCTFNGIERDLNEEDIVIRENESRSILRKVKSGASRWIGHNVSARKPYGLDGDAQPAVDGVPCWFKQSIGLARVNKSSVKDARGDLNMWRVLVPYAAPGGGRSAIDYGVFFGDRSMIIAKPGEYCTETFIVIKSFHSQPEARNFIAYMKTKFFRFMLRMRVVSQHITRENYNWVPDLEDYSAPWTDKELYEKFNLTRQEQAYVESKIRALKGWKAIE